jgi:16S rRNA processing protein RimM
VTKQQRNSIQPEKAKTSPTPNEMIIIGKFGKTFGIKGWITVRSFTDPKENIVCYKNWYFKGGKAKEWTKIDIEQSSLRGKNILVKILDLNTIEEVTPFINAEIAIKKSELPPLTIGEYYWAELEGLKVINQQNEELGTVSHLFATGANDVLFVKNHREHLIPFIKDVIIKVDLAKKLIVVAWDTDF